jgi:hypothetical protein
MGGRSHNQSLSLEVQLRNLHLSFFVSERDRLENALISPIPRTFFDFKKGKPEYNLTLSNKSLPLEGPYDMQAISLL